jgi:hypothetical protein
MIERDGREGDWRRAVRRRPLRPRQQCRGGVGILLLALGHQAGVDARLMQPRVDGDGLAVRLRRASQITLIGLLHPAVEEGAAVAMDSWIDKAPIIRSLLRVIPA